jgi:hypothetical protein
MRYQVIDGSGDFQVCHQICYQYIIHLKDLEEAT